MASRKLSILFASEAPVAVILRRGPSAWYHVIKWNTSDDTLESGAWFKVRLYEGCCDISADGEYLLYAAFQGRRSVGYTQARTALSRVPWLKAFMLWNSNSTLGIGGRFLDKQKIGLRFSEEYYPMHPDHKDSCGFEVTSFSFYDPHTRQMLPQFLHLYHKHRDQKLKDGAEWSHTDQHGRVVWTVGYELYVQGEAGPMLLSDFTGLVPNPQPAPY